MNQQEPRIKIEKQRFSTPDFYPQHNFATVTTTLNFNCHYP